jgi:hypothetical protein
MTGCGMDGAAKPRWTYSRRSFHAWCRWRNHRKILRIQDPNLWRNPASGMRAGERWPDNCRFVTVDFQEIVLMKFVRYS